MDSKTNALTVLSIILTNLQEGNDPLHGSALLFDDERTLQEHVREAVAALIEELVPQQPVVPRSQRRRIGKNVFGVWNGYISKGNSRKVITFGADHEAAHRWVQELPLDID